jgi:hypothetical protein
MPLLLVKPLIGFGPVELDLELSSEPGMSLLKIGLIIGRHAFWKVRIEIKTAVWFRLLTGDNSQVGFRACPDNNTLYISCHLCCLGIQAVCLDKHYNRRDANTVRKIQSVIY